LDIFGIPDGPMGKTGIGRPSRPQHRERIISSAMSHGVATMSGVSIWAREGGLIAYGPDYLHMYRRAPFYVDRVLKGTNPADLPVEQPTKVELVVNLKTRSRGAAGSPHSR
jgi:ABC-type uncharacterized transport system substrate-binding protein